MKGSLDSKGIVTHMFRTAALVSSYLEPESSLSDWFLTQPSKMQPLPHFGFLCGQHAKPYPTDTTASGKRINVTRPK